MLVETQEGEWINPLHVCSVDVHGHMATRIGLANGVRVFTAMPAGECAAWLNNSERSHVAELALIAAEARDTATLSNKYRVDP